jgi:AcrR family transcriptional regulator
MSGLVERSGASAATVRFYLAEGLLPPPQRLAANRFVYDERHVELLRLIRLLRERRHLPLEAIRRLLPELLPDLAGAPERSAFRPEMWQQLLRPLSRGDEPTSHLVQVGLSAFDERGYSEVSVDDVCRAAGIAKGSFYRHFASKEALFLAAVSEAAAEVVARLAELAHPDLPCEDLAEALSSSLGPHRTVFLDLASLASRGSEAHAAALREFVAMLTAEVTSISPKDADGVLARALAGLVVGGGPSRASRTREQGPQRGSLTPRGESTRMGA